MSITTETSRVAFVGDGNDNSPYAIPFPLRADGSVGMIYVTDSTGAEATKTNPTNYTIALAADFATATLTLVTTAPASGETMVIFRDEPATRLSNYNLFDGFPASILNSDYDKATMQDLTTQEKLDRSILVSRGHPNADLPLTPLILKGKGTYIIAVNTGETDFELLENGILDGTISPAKLLDADVGNEIIQYNAGLGEWEYRNNLTIDGTAVISSTLTSGPLTVSGDIVASGDLQVNGGDITSTSGAISFGNEDLSTTGDLASGDLTVTGNVVISGTLSIALTAIVTRTVAGTQAQLHVIHADNTNVGSDAWMQMRTGGASGGDPFIEWDTTVTEYVMGIDNSDSDKFVGSLGDTIGTANWLEVTVAGAVTFAGTLASGALTVTGAIVATSILTVNSDADGTTILGRAKIGSRLTDEATFAHFDRLNSTDYALTQTAFGDTYINAVTAGVLQLRINNNARISVTNTLVTIVTSDLIIDTGDLTVGGILTVNSDADGTTILGRTKIGKSSGDVATFAHFDHSTITNFALEQLSTGGVTLNSVGPLQLAVGGVSQITITTATVTINSDDFIVQSGDVTITAGDVNILAGNLAISEGFLNLGNLVNKTISAAVLVPTSARTSIFPQSGITDDLATVAAGTEGNVIILYGSSGNTITIKYNTGNILLKGAVDYVMEEWDSLTLCMRGAKWTEIARGDI